jgi:hypothetical protein
MKTCTIIALSVLLAINAIAGSTDLQNRKPWPKLPSECLNDDWFLNRFTALVRESMESPTAVIEITEHSKWRWRWMNGCPRLHQVVAFKFTAHSPVDGVDHSGSGMTVFIYEPVSGRSEIMSVTEASRVIKEGFEEHPYEQQAANDGDVR